jgi:hypothetical protein
MRTRLSHGAEPAIPSRATTTPSSVSTAETSTICGDVRAMLGRGLLRPELAGSAGPRNGGSGGQRTKCSGKARGAWTSVGGI